MSIPEPAPLAVAEIVVSSVEETMRLARVDLENEIARVRVWLLAGTTVVAGISIGLGSLLGGDAPLPLPLYFGAATIGAYGLRRLLRKSGVSATTTYLSITFDVLLFAMSSPVGSLFEKGTEASDVAFDAWLTTGIMSTLVFLHSLRGDRRSLAFAVALSALATSFRVLDSQSVGEDASGLLVLGHAYSVMGVQALAPLLIMTLGVIALAGGLAFYADQHARLRLRIHAKVLRYVPDAAFEQLKGEKTDPAVRAPGRLVEVTILASDLRGFTAMSERLSPQDVVRQLNGYHDAMCKEIERHGGMLDKLIGDGELAIFGWRAPEEDAGAGSAVECARAMRAALERLNRERGAKSLPPLAMGIGLHTGKCVAGNIGAGKKLSFTYIGDAVNAASRIEGLTKDLGVPVLASEATVERLASRKGIRDLGPQSIRGRTEAVSLHAIE